ncbi:MAG TPA: HAD family phosphatase [Pseudonocardiaceae bacterium]
MWPGIVFDLDGTLVNTDPHWYTAKVGLLRGHGYDGAEIPELPGGSLADTAQALADVLGCPDRAEIEAELAHRVLTAVTSTGVRPLPGARESLWAARAAGARVAIASTSPAALVDAVVTRAGLDVEVAVGVGPALSAKPAPDVYVEACRRLAVDRRGCLGVEDSTVGARAARAAGLAVLTVGPRAQGRGDWHVASLASTADLDRIIRTKDR